MSLFDVTLNSIPLSSLSDKIIVRDILEQPIEQDVYKVKRAMNAGQLVSKIVRRALTVRVVYVIRERDPRNRAEIQDKIAQWARDGGLLTVNYRSYPGQYTKTSLQLHTVLEIPPVQDSALKWTQDLSMTFAAYNPPYWESESEFVYQFQTGYDSLFGLYSAAVNVHCLGTAPQSKLLATIKNDSASVLQSLTISSRHCNFRFTGLGIAPGSSLYVEYDDENGLIVIRDEKNRPLLDKRTADSSDELFLVPGSNEFSIQSNVQVSGFLYYKGLYV